MLRAPASGLTVHPDHVPIIIGMIERGDRQQDIAAWFGLNQARIKDTMKGKYGPPVTVPNITLPPAGPPGIKGRRLHDAAIEVLKTLRNGDFDEGIDKLSNAIDHYDADEP